MSYVLSAFGTRSLSILALIVIVSSTLSPITIFPPSVILPTTLTSPVTPKSPVMFVSLTNSIVPVPLGRNSKLALETVVEIVF